MVFVLLVGILESKFGPIKKFSHIFIIIQIFFIVKFSEMKVEIKTKIRPKPKIEVKS